MFNVAAPDPIEAVEVAPTTTTSTTLIVASTEKLIEPTIPETTTTALDPWTYPVRILVVGDSTARSVGEGLATWGETSGATTVLNVGLGGCGVIDSGKYRHQPGGGTVVRDDCRVWSEEWSTAIAESAPDLIVVFVGPMDTMERQVEGDNQFRSVGDPVYNAAYEIDFAERIDVLATGGVPVLWATPAYIWADSPRGSGNRSPTSLPERVDALTALLETLTEADPRVSLFDFGRQVDAGDPEVSFDLRPDGVHYGVEQAVIVARDWLLQTILDAAALDLEGNEG